MEIRYYEWAKELCRCAKMEESFLEAFWNKLVASEGVSKEFRFYLDNGQFDGKYTVAGMTLVDIMIWQMDHFKSYMDRGLYDMQSNPDKMLLMAFNTMLDMEQNPEKFFLQYGSDTGTDYPGKF